MGNIRNQITIIGNLGADPEVVNFESGSKCAKFSVATNESYVSQNGDRIDDTQWHNVVAWGRLANVAEQILKSGSQVVVVGKMTYREYEDDKKVKRRIAEIKASEILALDKKKEEEKPADKNKSKSSEKATA